MLTPLCAQVEETNRFVAAAKKAGKSPLTLAVATGVRTE